MCGPDWSIVSYLAVECATPVSELAGSLSTLPRLLLGALQLLVELPNAMHLCVLGSAFRQVLPIVVEHCDFSTIVLLVFSTIGILLLVRPNGEGVRLLTMYK